MKVALTAEVKKAIRDVTILTSGIYALSVLAAASQYEDVKILNELKQRSERLAVLCSVLSEKQNPKISAPLSLPAEYDTFLDWDAWEGDPNGGV